MSEETGYEEVKPWGGHRRFKCDECAFDSLNENIIQEHVMEFHCLNCDSCDFTTKDPRELQRHAVVHGTTVVLTDSYGRQIG